MSKTDFKKLDQVTEEEKAFKIVEEANKKKQVEVDKFIKEYKELCNKYNLEFAPVQQLIVMDYKPKL